MDLIGSSLALLLVGETDDGEEDWAVFTGTIKSKNGELFLDRGPDKDNFDIRDEWLSRIYPVKEEVREILENCKFFLPLSVGTVSDDDALDMDATGLKWPK